MVEPTNLAVGLSQSRAEVLEAMNAQQLNQFRKDFAFVWRSWRALGEIGEDEMIDGMRESGAAVKAHLQNSDWMAGAMAHFAQLADAIRRDLARSERIRAEMQSRRAA